MKKVILFLFAICMCCLVCVMLTACGHEHTYQIEWTKDATYHWHACNGEGCAEISDKAEHTWNDGEITTSATAQADGVRTFTCTACGQTKTESVQLRTTVTKDEWIANFMINNYTLECPDYDGVIGRMKATENALYQGMIGLSGAEEMYNVLIDGCWYDLYNQYDGCYAMINEFFTNNNLGSMLFEAGDANSLGDVFDALTYDETEKAYYFTDLCYIYFENGCVSKIVKSEDGYNYTYNLSNVGTTTINLPEFTVVE